MHVLRLSGKGFSRGVFKKLAREFSKQPCTCCKYEIISVMYNSKVSWKNECVHHFMCACRLRAILSVSLFLSHSDSSPKATCHISHGSHNTHVQPCLPGKDFLLVQILLCSQRILTVRILLCSPIYRDHRPCPEYSVQSHA